MRFVAPLNYDRICEIVKVKINAFQGSFISEGITTKSILLKQGKWQIVIAHLLHLLRKVHVHYAFSINDDKI